MNEDKILEEFEKWLDITLETDKNPRHTFLEGLIVAKGKLIMLREEIEGGRDNQ